MWHFFPHFRPPPSPIWYLMILPCPHLTVWCEIFHIIKIVTLSKAFCKENLFKKMSKTLSCDTSVDPLPPLCVICRNLLRVSHIIVIVPYIGRKIILLHVCNKHRILEMAWQKKTYTKIPVNLWGFLIFSHFW